MIPLSLNVESEIPGLLFPTIVSANARALHSIFLQLGHSQWLPTEHIARLQDKQLGLLLNHLWANVPWYHQRLTQAGLTSGLDLTRQRWRALKTLSRAEIQGAGELLRANSIPKEHGRILTTKTSGSTGEPLTVYRTDLDNLMWQAMTLRDHEWHHRDLNGDLCVVRAGVKKTPDETWVQGWGPATAAMTSGGRSAHFPIDQDVAEIACWLQRRNPDYLLIYPNVLTPLLRHIEQHKFRFPNLKQIRTISEVMTQETRELCKKVLGVPVVDLYSSVEVGNLALQCPETDNYHLMAEDVLVEILNDQNHECQPGETGRVVVTSLHSFAAPLLRYELTDFAEVAPPCPCGRGLPTIKKIYGRSRNMLMRNDGTMFWPAHGKTDYREAAPVRQFQIVQLAPDHLEFRMVVERSLTSSEETAITAKLRGAIGNFSQIDLKYFEILPQGSNGKFEEFVSMVASDKG